MTSSSHILAIPFPASGHIIPHMDLIHQLALRGLTITIMVTPKNLHFVNPLLSLHPNKVQTLLLPFPSDQSIPPGVENMQDVTIDFLVPIATVLGQLTDSVTNWFKSCSSPPVAIFSDHLLNIWTRDLASSLGVKCVEFMPMNANLVSSCFAIVDEYEEDYFKDMTRKMMESWGLVINSFHDLESESFGRVKEYMKHDRVWGVGPVVPIKGGFERGGPSSSPSDGVLTWLDSCGDPVVYIGFGSQIRLNDQQTKVIADALEISGVRFVWAVKDPVNGDDDENKTKSLVPDGFEERVGKRGLVMRGWVPQAVILNHKAVVSYLTHCGWGSVLEGLMGGVLLLAWPMQVDHFYNTKMLVDQLGVSVRVCEGVEAIPDTEALAKMLAESTHKNRPDRDGFIKIREQALNAIKDGGTSFQAIDDFVSNISMLT